MKYMILEPICAIAEKLLQDVAQATTDNNDVDILIVRNRTQVNAELLDTYPKIKYVLRPGTGTDNIDLQLCASRNIDVVTSSGANANGVAELTMALMLMSLRSLQKASNEVKVSAKLEREHYMGTELKNKTIGIIGMGVIGRQLVKYLEPYACTLLAYDIVQDKPFAKAYKVTYTALESVLQMSDIVSLHVPLTSTTKHLLAKKTLSMMKKGSILINTARGGIIDSKALLGALKNHLGGYAADVIEDEPEMNTTEKTIAQLDNVIFTPHIGAQTTESFENMCSQAVKKVVEKLRK